MRDNALFGALHEYGLTVTPGATTAEDVETLRELLRALGYVIAPIEPTPAMTEAGWRAYMESDGPDDVYTDMIAALDDAPDTSEPSPAQLRQSALSARLSEDRT